MNKKLDKNLLKNSPGSVILEIIETKKISKLDLAKELDATLDDIEDIISGEIPIDIDLAKDLEEVLDVPAKFWIKLELKYRKKLSPKKAIDKHTKGWNEALDGLEMLVKVLNTDNITKEAIGELISKLKK